MPAPSPAQWRRHRARPRAPTGTAPRARTSGRTRRTRDRPGGTAPAAAARHPRHQARWAPSQGVSQHLPAEYRHRPRAARHVRGLGRVGDAGRLRVPSRDSLGVKLVIEEHGRRQPGEQIEQLVVEVRTQHPGDVLDQPVAALGDAAPRPVPEMKRADRVGRVDVPFQLAPEPLDRDVVVEAMSKRTGRQSQDRPPAQEMVSERAEPVGLEEGQGCRVQEQPRRKDVATDAVVKRPDTTPHMIHQREDPAMLQRTQVLPRDGSLHRLEQRSRLVQDHVGDAQVCGHRSRLDHFIAPRRMVADGDGGVRRVPAPGQPERDVGGNPDRR